MVHYLLQNLRCKKSYVDNKDGAVDYFRILESFGVEIRTHAKPNHDG